MGNNISNDSNSSNNSSSSSNNSISYKSHQELLNSSWHGRIKNKLLKDGNLLGEQSETELDNLTNSLGDETIFLNRYLVLEEVYNEENLQQITKDYQEVNDLKENNFIPTEEERRNMIDDILQYRRKADKFNVYLFIKIDGIVLEWDTGDAGPHLIYPKIDINRISKIARLRINYDSNSIISKIYEKLLAFVMSIGVIPSEKLQIIARKCVYWNKNVLYHSVNRNCQHFIDETLKALGLKFHPNGEFKKFLDRICNHADERSCSKKESSFRDKSLINMQIKTGTKFKIFGIKNYFYVIRK
ncbi:hypothetical protein F8M41_012808 [Gigaspora margarita]|uniref:PPPDE domain-containing protein n=1 Tax=Gigaspora margarita TaxID=4874 RepID=A0A8H4B3T4_GIGMA|nr:hypothetical protein F8M41_012808 [Gigaspora margarita]